MNTEKQDSRLRLFERQKELLDTFLEHGAISKAQYDKSLGDLKEKMGINKQSFRAFCRQKGEKYVWSNNRRYGRLSL